MSLDIWLKPSTQNIGIEDIIFTIWSKEVFKQRQSNLQKQHLSCLIVKKICYLSYNDSNSKKNYIYSVTNI